MTSLRITTADLEGLPDPLDDTRYEIIDGELYVAHQPRLEHQFASDQVCESLRTWSAQSGRGFAFTAPGVIFAEDDAVAPDVVWLSRERLRTAMGDDGHLHAAPELMVEVLSPGTTNERRDRELKLRLYSRRGVDEYWIVDCVAREVAIYRREGDGLELVSTLGAGAMLESPLLPRFGYEVERLFFPTTI